MQSESTYRPELDALRAVAVVAVIAYHFFPEAVPGGFVGVDVFFVLSGYLILRNQLRDLGAGRFTLADFYARRIRRLYPTYLTVLAACTVASVFLLSPDPMARFGGSLASSVAYASNVWFFSEAGYFDLGSHHKPLLHTWSLSVEEQFYLVFPAAIAWLVRRRWRVDLLLAGVVAASFGADLLAIDRHPTAVFYLSPFRMWEFAAGGLLAAGVAPRRFPLAAFVAGLASIVGSIALLGPDDAFPGIAAVPAVLGTYLAIAGSAGLAGHPALRWFTVRPVVLVGQLSYAAYLWHWPLLVFLEEARDGGRRTAADSALLLAATAILAALSTFVIEPPIRTGRISGARTAAGAVACSLGFLALGTWFAQSDGLPWRFPDADLYVRTNRDDDQRRERARSVSRGCEGLFHEPALTPALLDEICTRYGTSDRIAFAMWGDSHVSSLAIALAERTDASFVVLRTRGCPPLVGVQRVDETVRERTCQPALQQAIVDGLETLRPDHVMLVARWAVYHHGWHEKGQLQRNTHFLCDDDCTEWPERRASRASLKVLRRAVDRTLTALTAFSDVVVIESVPELGRSGSELVARPPSERTQHLPTPEEHRAHQQGVHDLFVAHADNPRLRVYDPSPMLCTEGRCLLMNRGSLCYFDDNHLTIACWSDQVEGILATVR